MVPTNSAAPAVSTMRRTVAFTLSVLLSLTVLAGAGMVAASPAQAWEDTLPPTLFELEVARLINESRVAEGLAPLTLTAQISDVARAWSGVMGDGLKPFDPWAAFEHNPDYSDQIPRGWNSAGENIAAGTSGWYTPALMHEGLMNSPGHRANIMNPSFTHMGLGIVHRNGFTWGTEVFATYRIPADAGTPVQIPGSPPPVVEPSTPVTHGSSYNIAQIVLSPDLSGDAFGDLITVDSNGALWIHHGQSNGFVSSGKRLASSGWKNLTVYAPGDFNSDGKADILAKNAAGELFFYPGDGNGSIGSGKRVGWGWGNLEIIPAGDLTGDGVPDVLAINPAGELFYYAGDGRGGFKGKLTKNGQGWRGFDLYPAGDINGDGRADILSVDRSGRLFTHLGKGNGLFSKSYQSGQGWGGFDLFAGADINRDRYADLYSRDNSGKLYFYEGRPGGGFSAKVHVGNRWG